MVWTVPRAWPDSTVVILAGGPSLTTADVDRVAAWRANAGNELRRVIAIKDQVRLAPWADVLYGCERKWWDAYQGAPLFQGEYRVSMEETNPHHQIRQLRQGQEQGLERDPSALATGANSGYQAINLAVHFGARRILLLGFDMQPSQGQDHWFTHRAYEQVDIPYNLFLHHFPTILDPLRELGIELINCSRETALTCVPRQPLEEALR